MRTIIDQSEALNPRNHLQITHDILSVHAIALIDQSKQIERHIDKGYGFLTADDIYQYKCIMQRLNQKFEERLNLLSDKNLNYRYCQDKKI